MPTAYEYAQEAASSPVGAAIIGGGLGILSARRTAGYASEAAEKANEFSERMSNTAMQRRRADLEAADYNPMLALGGPGAAAPVGQMAQRPDVGADVARGVTSALATNKLKTEKKLLKSTIDLNKEKKETEGFLQGVHGAETLKKTQEAIRANWETRIIAHKLPRAVAEAGPYVTHKGLMQKKLLLDHGVTSAQGGANVYRTLMGGGKDSMQLLKLFKMIQGMP